MRAKLALVYPKGSRVPGPQRPIPTQKSENNRKKEDVTQLIFDTKWRKCMYRRKIFIHKNRGLIFGYGFFFRRKRNATENNISEIFFFLWSFSFAVKSACFMRDISYIEFGGFDNRFLMILGRLLVDLKVDIKKSFLRSFHCWTDSNEYQT